MKGVNGICIALCAIFLAPPFYSQNEFMLELQVISSFALDVETSEHHFNMTVGQPEYTTLASGSHFLTQGFNQPIEHFDPKLTYTISFDDCTDEYTVEITSLGACAVDVETVMMWNGAEGESIFTTTDSSVVLMVFGSMSCNSTDTLVFSEEDVIEILCATEFYQLITPNSDGSNDAWIIENVEANLPENIVRIFNRWGHEVWQGKNYDNDNVLWTGRSKSGSELPDGTYYYTVEAAEQAWSGFVELHR